MTDRILGWVVNLGCHRCPGITCPRLDPHQYDANWFGRWLLRGLR